MHNIYLIYGNESYLINKKLEEIKKELNIIEDNIINYNLSNNTIEEVLEEASTVGMFDNKKLIICDNSLFLTTDGKKDEDIDALTKYINNPFDDVYIIFIVRKEKLDERKKIVKELKKISKVIECMKVESHNLNNYVDKYFKENGYEIKKDALLLMIQKASSNLSNLINEANKIMIYKNTDKIITKEDIDNLVIKNIEDNIFSLTNAIMKKDKKNIIKIYKDLLETGEEPIKLIVLVANQLRLILQVKLMIKNGYKEREMASIIEEHPYRVKLAIESNFTIKELIKYLSDLHDLDINIKTGKIDKDFGFELFLLNI